MVMQWQVFCSTASLLCSKHHYKADHLSSRVRYVCPDFFLYVCVNMRLIFSYLWNANGGKSLISCTYLTPALFVHSIPSINTKSAEMSKGWVD